MTALRTRVDRLEQGNAATADHDRPLYVMTFEQDPVTGGQRVFGYFTGDSACRELPADYDLTDVPDVQSYGPGMSWESA